MVASKVLIVEDEEYISDLLTDVFGLYQLPVVCAKNGAEAFDLMEKHDVSMMIIDFSLPDINGIELFRRIAKAHPDLHKRVILMSGYDPDAYFEAFFEEYPVKFMPKPFMINDLREVIESFIES